MFTIRSVGLAELPRYQALMYKWLYEQLAKTANEAVYTLVGAEKAGYPIGLLVLETCRPQVAAAAGGAESCAEVHSLFVAGPWRRQGVAGALLRSAVSGCREQGIGQLRLAYYASGSAAAVLEEWLAKRGWSEPACEALIFHMDQDIARAGWLRERSLPSGLRMIPWKEADIDGLRWLQAGHAQAYPPELSPFKSFAPLERSNSLALVSERGIEGWSIAYRLTEETVLYDALYVDYDYRQLGIALAVLAASVRLQLEAGIPKGLFTVNQTTPAMLSMSRHWMAPYARKISEKRRCTMVV